MLYKLGKSGTTFDSIEPMSFEGLPKEKHLEDLLAQNLFDVLFEGNDLMPIKQERAWQPEADIYALNRSGDVVIFELKKDAAGKGALHQALRYCEKVAHSNFDKLQDWFREYKKNHELDLQKEHQISFDLEHPMDKSAFNTNQHLIIVGSASDDELARNVDYWKSRGISITFVPYRIYIIGGNSYFEFFSPPYDKHHNPKESKGVLFDTNLSYVKEGIWYMCENDRVAAFGSIKSIVHSFKKGDVAFLYHVGKGIVAAGEVKGTVKEDAKWDAMYQDLKWLTPVPKRGNELKAFSAAEIKQLGFNFWWPKTMKPPFLDKAQTHKLLSAVNKALIN